VGYLYNFEDASVSVQPLLEISDLTLQFLLSGKWVNALSGLSLCVGQSEFVGIVGESGSGKSVTALSILRLISSANSRTAGGTIVFDNQDLLKLNDREMRKVRGNKISMIFQEPMTSLNPVFTVGDQISEVLRIHRSMSKAEARNASIELLKLVNMPAPEQRFSEYPHQLSGGMRQRVMIAIALACRPKLLIADEPTTALDVTIQAQIMALISNLKREFGMSVLLITHDLGVVYEHCARVMVMYGGRVVEDAPVEELFNQPKHPYTKGLLTSIPKIGEVKERLDTIAGSVPSLGKFPEGCPFQNRCPHKMDQCQQIMPHLTTVGLSKVACHLYPQ
jgi:oligopeptide/dipeptide ABC transporter ATP-binding protein